MRYSGLIKNDITAAPGLCVTLFVSGCDIHCYGCHNPDAQNFDYGDMYTEDTTAEIIQALQANSICPPQLLYLVAWLVLQTKRHHKEVENFYLW